MQKTNQQGYRLYLYCIGYKCVPSFNANCFTGFAHTGNNAGKTRFGIIVAAFVIVATYRYYELPKGVTLYNDYMQFDVHGVPDSRHREKSNPKVPYACIQKIQICKGKRPPKSIFNSKDDGWFDMGGSGERYIRITAEIYEEEIFVFYVDDPEAFVEALRDYMINAGAGKIWGV